MAKLQFGERCPWSWRSISASVRGRYSSEQQDGRKSPAVLSSPDVLVHQEQGLPPSWQLFLCWPKACESCRFASAKKAKSGSPGSWLHSLLFHSTAQHAHHQLWQRNGLGTVMQGHDRLLQGFCPLELFKWCWCPEEFCFLCQHELCLCKWEILCSVS